MEFYVRLGSEEVGLHTPQYKRFYTRVKAGLKDVLTKKSKSPDEIEGMILCLYHTLCVC